MTRSSRRNALIVAVVAAAVVAAVALPVAVQAFVVKPYRIPSPSMSPTLKSGDRVLVDRLAYNLHQPRRGDIVVFRYPGAGSVVLIKRIIGLPGETVSLQDGNVCIDGVELNEPYVARVGGRQVPTDPAPPVSSGTTTAAWSLDQPYKVPAGSYFVMGDDRTASDDSRHWGPVTKGALIGRAFLVYWPSFRRL